MVSTRIVIIFGTFLLLLGFGSGWVAFSAFPGGYTYFDLATWLGSTYGPCNCPPGSDTIEGVFLLVFIPLMASPGPMMAAMVLYPIGFVVAGVSIFRWKMMWLGGFLSILAGILWFIGVYLSQGTIVEKLEAWSGGGGSSATYTVWVQLGAYFALAGGLVLLLGYLLSRMDRLDWPID